MILNYEDIVSQVESLLARKECAEVEFKSARGGFPGSFWETYSAFANSEGGVIVLGVKEKAGELIADGLSDEEVDKYQKLFWDAANSSTTVNRNLLMNDDVQVLEYKGKKLLLFHIPQADRSQKPIYRTQNPLNGTYKRGYEGDYLCNDEEVKRMFADANVSTPADSRILPNFTMDDIDRESLQQFRRLFDLSKPGHPWLALDDIELLRKLGGYRKDRDTNKEGFTLAGLLMFGKTESITDVACAPHFFPDYRQYASDAPTGIDRWIDRICPDGLWEANLFQFYRRVLPKVTGTLPKPFRLDEDTRIDETTAHVALREALINLCVHADYSCNASLIVCQYPNRIELSNPGTLLVSRSQYYKGGESICRNTSLQKMFSLLGKAEKAGSGVDKILQGWKDKNWTKPDLEIKMRPDKVVLHLRMESILSDEVKATLTARLGSAYEELGYDMTTALAVACAEGEVTNERLQFMLDMHRSDITDLLRKLCDKGLLVAEGYGRGRKYHIQEPNLPTSEEGSIHTSDGTIHTSDGTIHTSEEGGVHTSDGNLPTSNGKSKRLLKKEAYRIIVEYCEDYRTCAEISRCIGKNEQYTKRKILPDMVKEQLIEKLFPAIPNHPGQKYIRTAKGEAFLKEGEI